MNSLSLRDRFMENPFEVKYFRIGELFCGPGGLGLGAKWAKAETDNYLLKLRHAWATDYDKYACETYRYNICPDKPSSVVCMDIRQLKDFSIFKNLSEIDALAFGFPCNDFSIVGTQLGINGRFGSLYKYGIDALHYFKPLWFLAENVSGLRSANDGKAIDTILNEMKDAGYNITSHMYKFEEYGVPQSRHRIIIIGIKNELNINFKIPSPLPFLDVDISCRKAIENPPIPCYASNNELTNQSKTVMERLKHIKPGENAFNANLPEDLQLNVKGAKISQIYRRLKPDKPSYTITGSGGGGTHVYHWTENRALTNRERARLQTFPDDFIFKGPKESVRKQIGMAVPPKFANIIFNAILKSFLVEYYKR